jgi:hypothetical protein
MENLHEQGLGVVRSYFPLISGVGPGNMGGAINMVGQP